MGTEVKGHSTSTGAVIGPEADVSGPGGLFTQLINEHGELTRLIRGVFEAKTSDQQKSLYPVLRTDLLAHERTERAVLYATLRQFSATQSVADQHDRRLGEIERMLGRLDSLQFWSEEWLQCLGSLSELLQRHVREEEDELFPLCANTLGQRKSEELEIAYLGTKPGIVNTIEADAPTLRERPVETAT